MYLRYVDDTICIFRTKMHTHHFVRRLKNNSVLNFTHETMEEGKFQFLDVSLSQRPDGAFNTSVYIKPTDKGVYTNFESHIPLQYKRSVINTLVNRAIKLCSTPASQQLELKRITQVLVNNGYPQNMIDHIIARKLEQSNHATQPPDPPDDPSGDVINFYAELHNVSNFKDDTKRLRGLIHTHVSPTKHNDKVRLTTFYRPSKLSSKFSNRIRLEDPDRSSCVYQFQCSRPSCHEVKYYGYTNQRLSTRVKQHRRKDSSICKHFMDIHNDMPPKYDEFMKCFKIIFSHNDILNVQIAEAILIKNDKPIINVKYNELYDFLNLF